MDYTAPPPPGSTPAFYPPIPPPPAKPRRSRGWMIAAIVLLLLLGISLLLNVGQFVGSLATMSPSPQRSAGPRLEEVTLENHDSRNKIAVVPVEGIIFGSPADGSGHSLVDVVKAQLRRAAKDTRVKAVVLKVDSPGGEVLASDEIADAIREFQDESGKPVVASLGNLAASGGYYISAPCRWIVAHELTITGSIGVIISALNYRGLMDKVGLEPTVYKSGQFKDMLSGARKPGDVTDEERRMIQSLITETYSKFTNVVATGRQAAHEENATAGRQLAADWDHYADGRVFSGKDAFKLGFVDELGNFQTAIRRARELAGLRTANVVEYRRFTDLSDILRLFGETESRTLKVDLGWQPVQLQAGQPYFLSPLHLP